MIHSRRKMRTRDCAIESFYLWCFNFLFRASGEQHRVFWKGFALVVRLSHKVHDERAIKSDQESNAVDEERLARKLAVFAFRHREKCFFRQAQQASGNRQHEAQQAEEDVNRHVEDSYVLLQHREQIRDEAGDILTSEHSDRDDANPTMQRVQIRNFWNGVVVRVECC